MNIKKNARNAAVYALLRTDEDSGYSNIVLDKTINEFGLSEKDASLCSIIFYGVLEKRLLLDYVVSRFSKRKPREMEPEIREILRCAVYQIMFLTRVPQSAAVNEAVNSAKDFCGERAVGFTNGVLRGFLRGRDRIEYPVDKNTRDSIEYSVPLWLIMRLRKTYGAETADSFLQSTLSHAPLYIRVNTAKISEEELQKKLETEDGVQTEKTALPGALLVSSGGNAAKFKAFSEGLFHVQDISSQLAVYLLNPKPDSVFCDVCAAPGGKTFTAAEYMKNTGSVYSYDLYKGKVGLIESGAERLSLTNIKAAQRDAVNGADIPKSDFVLCDVPCSGFGIIRRKPEIRYKEEVSVRALPQTQLAILSKSAGAVSKGGRLMYSTCTLLKEENSMVTKLFLESHPEFKRVPLSLPKGFERSIKEEENEITLFPHKNAADGFFISLFERI